MHTTDRLKKTVELMESDHGILITDVYCFIQQGAVCPNPRRGPDFVCGTLPIQKGYTQDPACPYLPMHDENADPVEQLKVEATFMQVYKSTVW